MNNRYKSNLRKFNDGFSIVEMLSYIVVLLGVVGSVIFFSINLVRNERTFEGRIRVTGELDFAMRHIVDETRSAAYVYSATSTTPRISVFNTGSSPCTTSCKLSVARSRDGIDATAFYVDTNGRLIMDEIHTGSITRHELTSKNVSVIDFTIQCVGNSSPCESGPEGVTVQLTLRDTINPTQTQSVTTAITPQRF